MFETEKDDRIRGLDETSTAVAMAFAHDFLLEVLLTREMLSMEPEEATFLSRLLVERWQRRYGAGIDEGSGQSVEVRRRLYASKAFVDRLARKALRRSADQRQANRPPASAVDITTDMKREGAAVLAASSGLSAEDMASAIYRAMVVRDKAHPASAAPTQS